jgi:signal transduction histidine kinase
LVQRELLSHRVSLRTEFAPALPMVLADRVQLQQVLINLLMNAVEAMQRVTGRPRQLVIRSDQDEARRILVAVEDCGVRISAENTDRLFNAFFTTKSSGMGMGLSICRSIIEAHGGRMSAATMPGRVRRFNSLCQCIKWHRRDHVRRAPNTSRGARFGPLRLVARAARGFGILPPALHLAPTVCCRRTPHSWEAGTRCFRHWP